MKTIIQVLFISLFTLLFTGCDYLETRDFIITNQTDSEIIIKTIKGRDHIYFYDSIHTIKPYESKTFSEDMGICALGTYPPDYFTSEDTLPFCNKFDMYIGDSLKKKDIRVRKNWGFQSEKHIGVYTLEITNELLSK